MDATRSDRKRGCPAQQSERGFLRSLARDTAGNTLAMMAAFIVPLAALAGSAVDMSRAYLVRVRLQQACDAGVLAGRKLMNADSGSALDKTGTAAKDAADDFFENNFPTGWMGTTGRTFTAVRITGNQVYGTGTVTLPMAIMGMFGFGSMTQTVTCTARLDIGDSDVMFVLDTTGSMACATGEGCGTAKTWIRDDDATINGTKGIYVQEVSTGAKIQTLRDAVKLFRTTLASNKPAAAHIRYGFVPYSASVNVGALIKAKSSNYLADTVTYQSRKLTTTVSSPNTDPATQNYNVALGGVNYGDVNYGTEIGTAPLPSATTKALCLAATNVKRKTAVSGTNMATGWPTGTANPTLYRELPEWKNGACTIHKWNVKPLWSYQPVSYSTATLKAFVAVTDPSKFNTTSAIWQGCVEERVPTTSGATFNADNLPDDLDPDLIPTSAATQWRPLWPEVIYYRPSSATATNSGTASVASSDNTATTQGADYSALLATIASTGSTMSNGSLGPYYQYAGCGAQARRLKEYETTTDVADFNSYLGNYNGTTTTGNFRAYGHTYHDVGMMWGLRLISPDGIWKEDTAAWGSNNAPQRYIVFMTDGLMNPDPLSYGMYGVEKYDGRIYGSPTTADTASYHRARFKAICDAAKNKNITVFVVAFDLNLTATSNQNDVSALRYCATEGYFYGAQTAQDLKDTFENIALQVARLRLSQ